MIVFDLRCHGGHIFEAWFASSAAFEEQRAAHLVHCPQCDDARVQKAVMAPNISSKGNRTTPKALHAETVLQAIVAAQAKALESSEWVGHRFPDRARAMYLGEEQSAPIHGETTPAEARELLDEGVPIAPLLVPIVPPHLRN